MDGTTNCIILERLHLKALIDDTLTGDSGITVNNDGHDLLTVLLLSAQEVLFGTSAPLHARIDGFQVRWVRHQSQLDLVTRVSITSAEGCSKMVFNIASLCVDRLSTLLWLDALEFCHDDLHGLSDNISESVKSTSMRHTNDKSSGAFLHSGVNAEFESWDEGLAALETESFHGIELAGHESTPLVRPVKTRVHVHSLTFRRLAELNRFELLTDPVANFTILDMHELHGNLIAVCFAVGLNQIAKNPLLLSLDDGTSEGHLDVELAVHVRLSEAVVSRVEQG